MNTYNNNVLDHENFLTVRPIHFLGQKYIIIMS